MNLTFQKAIVPKLHAMMLILIPNLEEILSPHLEIREPQFY